MARIIAFGEPVNDSERRAIAYLRDKLPDNFSLIHNFELLISNQAFEIDLAVIAPHALYLIDVKSNSGEIYVSSGKWYITGRPPFISPLSKLRQHAKILKTLLVGSPERLEMKAVYVDAVVLFTEENCYLNDPSGVDSPSVVSLSKSIQFLQDTKRLPFNNRPIPNLLSLQGRIIQTIQGTARTPADRGIYGDWKLEERLGGTVFYTEYRAYNRFAGPYAGKFNLRIYKADPYLPQNEREIQAKCIATAYTALNALPPHPAIPGARSFFQDEVSHRFILVTEEITGKPLDVILKKSNNPLTVDQKQRIVKDILSALDHIHSHNVVHRSLNPSTIILSPEGQTKITDFDFARTGFDRGVTVGSQIYERSEDNAYLAPEIYFESHKSGSASDIYSAAMIFFELFVGDKAFSTLEEAVSLNCIFTELPSNKVANLPAGFDSWLQSLCTMDPENRPSAKNALVKYEQMVAPDLFQDKNESPDTLIDYLNLPSGYQLTQTYVIERRLGNPGSFGVAYKVIDTLGDVPRVVKIILRDRISLVDRLKQEYQHLLRIPFHPNVVKVIHADYLAASGHPYLVFEYIEGFDIHEMIRDRTLSLLEAKNMALQVAEGLQHLHKNGVTHCDIKPNNLLWTEQGAKIIDFNVSISVKDQVGNAGGSRKYIPPDSNFDFEESEEERQDRDLFALGVTLYQAVTGSYPWEETNVPVLDRPAPDPRTFSNCHNLSNTFVEVILKSISPKRVDRYKDAGALISALKNIHNHRITQSNGNEFTLNHKGGVQISHNPNSNPFVSYLATLYSQSKKTNTGTRGLDRLGGKLYVETALDKMLVPEVLDGKFRLVIISGNAGDGKTAFLQNLEKEVVRRGEVVSTASSGNGAFFRYNGRAYLSNYDGSQDEGEKINDKVLFDFLEPFQGTNSELWPPKETRLIAINEGRLIDFLEHYSEEFSLLKSIIYKGLRTCSPEQGIVAINLNLRSIVAFEQTSSSTIFDSLLDRYTDPGFWEPCTNCDLRPKCFVFHNYQTFRDSNSGQQVKSRLRNLFTLTSLRGKLHITLRDLSSALSFMFTSAYDCREIHQLYSSGEREKILDGFYFNSWMGGNRDQRDRLLRLLQEIDIGNTNDARIDRYLDFRKPHELSSLMSFEERVSNYDRDVLQIYYCELPSDTSLSLLQDRLAQHNKYVKALRRLHYFECRDDSWSNQLPYRSANRLMRLIDGTDSLQNAIPIIINGLNRGESLFDPERLKGKLAIQVRRVEGGTIKCFRVLPATGFKLVYKHDGKDSPYIENRPSGLLLRFSDEVDQSHITAEMNINLDVYEMLERLNQGYKPSVEEIQGFWLSLNVFKNILSSAPYQEILLTPNGHNFYSVERLKHGKLIMKVSEPGLEYAATKEG